MTMLALRPIWYDTIYLINNSFPLEILRSYVTNGLLVAFSEKQVILQQHIYISTRTPRMQGEFKRKKQVCGDPVNVDIFCGFILLAW